MTDIQSPPSLGPEFLLELATLIENLTEPDLLALASPLAHAFQRLAAALPRRRTGRNHARTLAQPPRPSVRVKRLRQMLEAALAGPTSIRQLHAAHGGKSEVWGKVARASVAEGLLTRGDPPHGMLHITAAGHERLRQLTSWSAPAPVADPAPIA